MADVKPPKPARSRTTIRRIFPERLADFDEQVWPVNLAILAFAGFVTGIVLATVPDFFDPRPFYNGFVRLGIIAFLVIILLWSTSRVRAPTARRIQFCIVLSLLLHMVLAVFLREQYLKLIAYIRDKAAIGKTESEDLITMPDYGSDDESSDPLWNTLTPAASSPLPENPSQQTVPPQFEMTPPANALVQAPRDTLEPLREPEKVELPRASQREISPPPESPSPVLREPARVMETLPAQANLETVQAAAQPVREAQPRDQLQPDVAAIPEPARSNFPHDQPPVPSAISRRQSDGVPQSTQQAREIVRRESFQASPLATPAEVLAAPALTQSPEASLTPPQREPERRDAAPPIPRMNQHEQLASALDGATAPPSPTRRQAVDPSTSLASAEPSRPARTVSGRQGLTSPATLAETPSTSVTSPTQPERPVALAGPQVSAILPRGGTPETPSSLLTGSSPPGSSTPGGLHRTTPQAEPDLAGAVGSGVALKSPTRSGSEGPVLGSVASLASSDLEASGVGDGRLRGSEVRLEPRATGVGPAPISIGLAPQAAGTGTSGRGETGAGLVQDVLGGLGALAQGAAEGLGSGRQVAGAGESLTVGESTGMSAGQRGGATGPTLIEGLVALEHSSAPGTETGPSRETMSGPTGDLAYSGGILDPAQLPLPPGRRDGPGAETAGRQEQSGGGGPATSHFDLTDLAGVSGGGGRGLPGRLPLSSAFSAGPVGPESAVGTSPARVGGSAATLASSAPVEGGFAGTSESGASGGSSATEGQGTDISRQVGLPSLMPAGLGPAGREGLAIEQPNLPARSSSRERSPELSSVGAIAGRVLPRMSGATTAPATIPGSADVRPVEAFAQRQPGQRAARASEFGGSQETEKAVELGLEFLAKIQFPDGHWSLHRLPDHVPDPQKTFQLGTMHGDTAATGLALLAFLGAGYTHQTEKYRDTVHRGLRWLVNNQLSDGRFFRQQTDSNVYTHFYGHGLATIAICEAYGMTRDPALRQPAERAVQFIIQSQNPELGGWRYQSRKETDTSVTGWQLMALKSAQMAGLSVPYATLQGVSNWLDKAQVDGGARYVYSPFAGSESSAAHLKTPNRAMTAEGLLMRIYLGWGPEHPALQKGAEFLAQNLPAYGDAQTPLRDAYYWYYATQVMFQMQGDLWRRWNDRIQQVLLREQVTSGPWAGSWDPSQSVPDRWGKEAGRVYVTAIQLLILEVYYRHLPLFKTLAQKG